MSRKHLLLFIFSVAVKVAFGQQEAHPSPKFSVAPGYENALVLDQNASPLLYVSNNGLLSLGYEKENENSLWNIRTQLSLGSNQSKRHGIRTASFPEKPDLFGNVDTTYYELNPVLSFMSWSVNFSKFWKIGHHWYLGGELGNGHYYGAIGADSWFFNAAALRPGVLGKFSTGEKSRLSLQVSSAVVSFIVRQPYTLDPSLPIPSYAWANIKTGSSVATLNSFQSINIKTAYFMELATTKEVGIEYQFQWMNHAQVEGRNLKKYSNSIALSYNF